MSSVDVALVVLLSLIGFTLQGSVGFGMGLLCSPTFLLIDARLVPGPVLTSTLVFTTLLALREHEGIDLGGLRWAVGGRVLGTVPAAWLLVVLPSEGLTLLLGLVVLVAVALSISGLRVRPRPSALVVGGVLSGLMGTIAAIGGPPLALLYQHAPGPRVRGTLSGLFLPGTVVSIVSLVVVGRYGVQELRLSLLLLPGALLGFLWSRGLATRLDRGYTRPAVLLAATIAGLIVIGRSLASW
ncbi:MAG: TSUP family transporter [Acidobacteriota bacterium]|nr:TSUP family transporter [Acidobacteriota bacterium]